MSEGAVGGEGTAVTVETPAAPAQPTGASAVLSEVPATPAGDGAAPAEPVPSWQTGLDSDSLAFVSNKGWDKAESPVGEMLKSYRNVERLRGVQADQLVRIPEAGNEEQTNEFYSRLGVPESAEGYESPELTVGGEALQAEPIAAISHALKLTPQQHSGLMEQVAGFIEATQVEQNEALNAKLSAEKLELDGEWGPVLEENTLAAKKGFGLLEWDESTIDAVEAVVGYKKTMKLAALVGRMSGEGRRGDDGEGSTGAPLAYGLTREAARSALETEGSTLMAKARNGDKAAAQKLQNLNQVAYHS